MCVVVVFGGGLCGREADDYSGYCCQHSLQDAGCEGSCLVVVAAEGKRSRESGGAA